MHLAARLHPDQLGSLQTHSVPRSLAVFEKRKGKGQRGATRWIEPGKIRKRKGKTTKRDG